jgi:oligopeptide/dipeptide ABC transporter ATP-binding protein
MTGAQPLLDVHNLVKQFPVGRDRVLTAVNKVSFRLSRGETLALVGESGSGKTTVGRCVLRVLEPTDGSIYLDGREITHLGAKQLRPLRQRIQVVFQDPYDSLNPRMAVGSIVAEPLREFVHLTAQEERERVTELLRQVGLDSSLVGRFPHHLTSGQQQRVAIARALALDPDILVLDEPTSALDPIAREHIIALLRSLQDRLGTAFLFISHDLVTVRHISDRICVMYLGEIVEEGPVRRVFECPDHPYSRALLASAPSVERRFEDAALVSLSGEIPNPIDLPKGCFLASRCPFVLEDCRASHPALEPVDGGRRSRCFRTTGHLPEIEADAWHAPAAVPTMHQEAQENLSVGRAEEG